ncbi:hypothetical protein BBK14_20820 [Parafrankia soli]|uniref:CobQ/CobB/MinD/ParA nucleotide binding domain-containing protein n=1 Tax=Parafrankia soli TaxID=2599596 RepID=A0A1S1PXG2_9ACTN|nr:hypothetical protein [Parafrankia soli]OHV27373.1 hypothetical protein BBK14_20820 [Parafrankia soli]
MQVTGHGSERDAAGGPSSRDSGSEGSDYPGAGRDPFGAEPEPVTPEAGGESDSEGDARPVSLLGMRMSQETQPGRATVSRRQTRSRPRPPRPEPGRGAPPPTPPAVRRTPASPAPAGPPAVPPPAAAPPDRHQAPPSDRQTPPDRQVPPGAPAPAPSSGQQAVPPPAPPSVRPPSAPPPPTPTRAPAPGRAVIEGEATAPLPSPAPAPSAGGWTPDVGIAATPTGERPPAQWERAASFGSLPTLPPSVPLPPAPPPPPSPAPPPPNPAPRAPVPSRAVERVAPAPAVPRPAAPLPAASETPRPSAEVVPATDRRPAVRALRVLVGGFGGGCGRTTVAAGLGMALAARAHSRIAAVDACPDQYGMLTQRVGLRPRRVGLRELAGARPPVASLTELRRYLAADGPGGLEVLPGVHDLTAPGLAGDELAAALDLLARWFPVVIADGPSGWSQPVPATLLARSDLVVVTTRAGEAELAATDDALTALTALTALGGAGRRDLAASALVAVVETYPTRLTRAARQRLDDLAGRARLVVVVPFDPALTDSRPFAWRSLRKRTRAAFDDLATAVDPASVAGPGGRPPGTG